MNKQNQSVMRSLVLVTMLFLVVVSLACATFTPTTKTPEPEPAASPTPTATPVPPRPVIPYTPVPSDMLAPILVQRSPKQGQMLAPDGTIELVFDKPMDQQTVAKALRVEQAGTTQAVDGTLSWVDDRTATFSPNAELPRGETYDVILTQDAKASTGETLRQPYTFRFSTVSPLQVTQVIPATDTTDVETDATITVMFNRPVVPLTTLQQMDTLPDPLTFEPALTGSGEWLNTSIYVLQPDTQLAGGITYKVTVSDELQDLSGTPLPEAYTWQFTTVPPKVLWVTPREDATLVDINTGAAP